MKLRPYQAKAIDSVLNEWKTTDRTMFVMPTGCGKTICFAHLIKQVNAPRTLVIAHREELILQAVDKIQKVTGWRCDVEMAEYRANLHDLVDPPRVIVSTVQTQTSGGDGSGRMGRFDPAMFDLLVIDENHHAVSKSYRKIIDYYSTNPNLKVLGVTATPDRADEKALGQVFQSCAFDYEILDSIQDGWLVPVRQQMITIEGLDFSHIRTTAGDLNGADLGAVMEAEKNLLGVASATLEIVGQRRTLVFSATVAQAERLCEIFNRHREGSSEFVCGETDREKRREIFGRFASGKTQILTNCAVATEGYDNPAVEVIVMAKPTKSRSLYAQMAGRALRPADCIANKLNDWPLPAMRRHMIETSEKPSALIVDFVGNAGRHKLMSTADVLGGKMDDDIVDRAVTRAKEGGQPVDMTALLEEELRLREEEKQKEAARRAKLTAKAKYAMQNVDPFDVFQIKQEKPRGWDIGRELTQKQKDLLLKQGLDPDALGYSAGRQIIAQIFERWDKGQCSFRQARILRKRGLPTDISREEAGKLLDEIAKKEGWKQREPVK